MKKKHIEAWINVCLEISKLSNCERLKFGAVLINPDFNTMIASGYNGGPRGGNNLCGKDCCLRNEKNIKSGSEVQIGCVHAEMNLICNAAKQGSSTNKCWMLVNGEPCEMCAKLIHHAGIDKVLVIKGGYTTSKGIEYLIENKVEVELINLNKIGESFEV